MNEILQVLQDADRPLAYYEIKALLPAVTMLHIQHFLGTGQVKRVYDSGHAYGIGLARFALVTPEDQADF